MKLSIDNRKFMLFITLSLAFMICIFFVNKPHPISTLSESDYEVMLREQMLLMTDVFNVIGSKVDGNCDPSMKSELLATVMKHSLLYSLTLLKNNQPYCSSHHDDESYSVDISTGVADRNIEKVLSYINIDEEFTIQAEMKSLVHQVLTHHYLLAFMVMKGDGNEYLHDHINVSHPHDHSHLVSPYIDLHIDSKSRHRLIFSSPIMGLLMLSTLMSIYLFMHGGQPQIDYVFKKYLLKKAIIHHELKPYMQPVVSSTDGRVIGGEILLRWIHPKKGIVYPADFICVAERSGLIIAITKQLFERVKNELLEIAPHLPSGFKVGFNISATHLGDPELVQDCVDFIDAFKPGSIVMMLEITEQEAIVYTDRVYANIAGLRQAGIKLAIDDYGTGNSTLQNIQKIPFDYIKIDKSFVELAATDKISMDILVNIISLAVSINAKTVAEGVETAEQAKLLALSGVHFQQGWLWSKAIPISDVISLPRLTHAQKF